MPVTVVLGTQWGDEGKGKIVDLLGAQADVVARYQGGANAGHTIVWGDRKVVLHLIPSGIFSKGVVCVIGHGVVIDPFALLKEIDTIRALGYPIDEQLKVSLGAHLILPYHKAIEAARETMRADRAIGTTRRGIGPAYVDKVARTGIRVGDLIGAEDLASKVSAAVREKNALLKHIYHAPLVDQGTILAQVQSVASRLAPFACDTTTLLHRSLAHGRHVLAEGAQGALLDVDFGSYPYVTSSSPTVGGACTGLGIPPSAIDRVIGVTKAYATRVGNGPFPTELEDRTGERLRNRGAEFGATTGRPRRCGWLDLVALRYAVAINGVTELALTKLDVLAGFEQVRVSTGYRIGQDVVRHASADERTQRAAQPVYDTLSGWATDIRGAHTFEDLPAPARALVRYIARAAGVRVGMISTGPRRSETIRVDISP